MQGATLQEEWQHVKNNNAKKMATHKEQCEKSSAKSNTRSTI
jgi:hypothetical protein